MKFSFENQGTHTYLVYTVAAEDTIDSMSLGMITNNKISGLAQAMFTQMDTTKFIKYDVSAKISVKQFFTGQVNKKRLIGVFNGIVDAILSAEDYMIDVNSILLDLDYIFADVSTCETVLVCLPIVSDDFSKRDLASFFKNIMFSTQFDQTENCDHVAKIINYLNSSPVFSLQDFKEVLDNIDGTSSGQPVYQAPVQNYQSQPAQPTQTAQAAQQPIQPAQPTAASQPFQPKPQPFQSQPQSQPAAKPESPFKKPFATPPANNGNAVPPVAQPASTSQDKPEKEISLFGLLMSYSKENAELYKAQKAAKKAKKSNNSGAPAPAQPKAQPKAQPSVGFAIPGQKSTIQPTASPKPQQQPTPSAAAPTPQPQPQQVNKASAFHQPQVPTGQAMNFGETTVLGGGGIGETTVLGVSPVMQAEPHLIRVKNNEKIRLDKPVFRIGKEKSYVDYFIGDNAAISRSHANIISRDGEFFVIDTNSTNHTYVNDKMIQSNIETKIEHGTKIKFANEDFEFRLH